MDKKKYFFENGWLVLDLLDPSPVFSARKELQKELNRRIGKNISLEDYHREVKEEEFHTELQIELTDFFRRKKMGKHILTPQLNFFKKWIGLDLLIQAEPYLRMARPQKKQDNIGYHRDTFYGGSPYELSILIPYVDLNKENALKVLPGSHLLPEDHFPTVQTENPDPLVRKGSKKHQLGFLYAPKVLQVDVEKKMKAVPLQVGQILLFSLSIVHGCVENKSNITRWSSDIRIMHAFAPVDLRARPNYYEPFCQSEVTAQAKEYFIANSTK